MELYPFSISSIYRYGAPKSNTEIEKVAEIIMASILPFSLQVSSPRSSYSSLGLSWGGLETSMKLPCKASGYTFSDYNIYWVKQSHEKGLEWIGFTYPGNGGTGYAQKFKGKATLTADKSSSTAYMELHTLISEDSGDCYCARHCVAIIY